MTIFPTHLGRQQQSRRNRSGRWKTRGLFAARLHGFTDRAGRKRGAPVQS